MTLRQRIIAYLTGKGQDMSAYTADANKQVELTESDHVILLDACEQADAFELSNTTISNQLKTANTNLETMTSRATEAEATVTTIDTALTAAEGDLSIEHKTEEGEDDKEPTTEARFQAIVAKAGGEPGGGVATTTKNKRDEISAEDRKSMPWLNASYNTEAANR